MTGTLCKAPTSCPDFRQAYELVKPSCEKCGGDIGALREHTRIIDTAMSPVVDQVLQNTPEYIFPKMVDAINKVREDLSVADGVELDDADALIAIVYRLAQRTAGLESAVRRATAQH